ncbi:glycoside hydrolase family 16 protein [Rhodocollybia butyracea]|uniref:Glycoside hydrolase family 16 protein n=1 Tax=Rhodocollybia butyracea TaxID=206335 RepID=A0A9P5TWS9_9AGAR|nr:glycoside hydrolase family 16 protein [Rhodocollybia butyracea]
MRGRNLDEAADSLLDARESQAESSYGPFPSSSSFSKRQTNSSSIADKYSLSADPATWGSNIYSTVREADDSLHSLEPQKKLDAHPFVLSSRAFANLGCLAFLLVILVGLFLGYPVLTFAQRGGFSTVTSLNTKTNGTGQVPSMPFGLVDIDTPSDARTKTSLTDGTEWTLVFSDEFNTDGRSFYPGDDPYWEAVNLNYWETNNLEWYDPAAITTANGSLVITYEEKQTHNLSYQGGTSFVLLAGMLKRQSCFPVSTTLRDVSGDVFSLFYFTHPQCHFLLLYRWPAIWTLGNLGRAGYGATLDGMWPYTYDNCDVGTAPNQTINGAPLAATLDGASNVNGALSYLPGQRLSRCTCAGESHPGPVHSDGTYVGRSAPEIDMFEAQVTGTPLTGQVSQSAQWAPFNDKYIWLNTTQNLIIPNTSISALNSYIGGDLQQASSVVTTTNQDCYELSKSPCYSTYGFEYKPGFDNAYISWISSGTPAWTLNVAGMGADPITEIAARPVPQEPMYLIINLVSENFAVVDFEHLTFPNHLRVDYIRVYQDPQNINIGCDPEDFPTADYINTYLEAYTNPNLTNWEGDFKQPWPKNSLLDSC